MVQLQGLQLVLLTVLAQYPFVSSTTMSAVTPAMRSRVPVCRIVVAVPSSDVLFSLSRSTQKTFWPCITTLSGVPIRAAIDVRAPLLTASFLIGALLESVKNRLPAFGTRDT